MTGNPATAVRELRRYKRGAINAAELGKRLALRETKGPSTNYMVDAMDTLGIRR